MLPYQQYQQYARALEQMFINFIKKEIDTSLTEIVNVEKLLHILEISDMKDLPQEAKSFMPIEFALALAMQLVDPESTNGIISLLSLSRPTRGKISQILNLNSQCLSSLLQLQSSQALGATAEGCAIEIVRALRALYEHQFPEELPDLEHLIDVFSTLHLPPMHGESYLPEPSTGVNLLVQGLGEDPLTIPADMLQAYGIQLSSMTMEALLRLPNQQHSTLPGCIELIHRERFQSSHQKAALLAIIAIIDMPNIKHIFFMRESVLTSVYMKKKREIEAVAEFSPEVKSLIRVLSL